MDILIRKIPVDVNSYYQPGQLDEIKKHILNFNYNLQQKKLNAISEKINRLRRK